MILVNLLQEKNERDPLGHLRQLVVLAIPFFVVLVGIASWPDTSVTIRTATLEEKETVVELLGRLPTYYDRLDKISATIVDEIAFDRANLLVREEAAPVVNFDDTSMTISEGFLKSDPRTQAQALSTAIAPHEVKARSEVSGVAVRGE